MSALGPVGAAPADRPATPDAAAQGADAATQAKVDYDAFLTLLVAQIENQDPTKPMDSTDFVAQLATFSNVEQAVETNRKLDALLAAAALDHAALIGRRIETADGAGRVASVRLADGALDAVLEDGRTLPLAGGWTLS